MSVACSAMYIHSVQSPDDSQAVVFIGILSSKTSTKQSKNNKNYATWILSDLKNSSV